MPRHLPILLVAIAVGGLAVGSGLAWSDHADMSATSWTIATLPVLGALFLQIILSLRRGDVGLDIVAALSMSAALAFGEPLAGNVVAMMYSGGQLLEAFAQGRAGREMTALLGRVARTAMCVRGRSIKEIPIDDIVPGDTLIIREGEVLPVDGRVSGEQAILDLSALTGEAIPQRISRGGEALSGATSTGAAFELVALRPAAQSTYAGIVRLVEAAQRSKAPMVRMADRYAIWFLVLTVALAGAAWLGSGDPLRALAVLVVATPCPLILAVPVAMISGMSRAARCGVLIKSGGVLEAMAGIRTVILDKTGTLTHGRATIREIRTESGFGGNEVLRLAASLDQASGHVVAAALIEAAGARGLVLSRPTSVSEVAGLGIEGRVEGRRVAAGTRAFVTGLLIDGDVLQAPEATDALTVAVAIDGRPAGTIVMEDVVRADAAAMLTALRLAGISRVVLASGDRSEIARSIGKGLNIDLILGDLTPEQKVGVVQSEAASGPVMMVGDGVNDAPALAVASVGVAMGARGAAASSQAAGVVVLVDQLAPLAKALGIAHRTLTIGLQSVLAGLGLSLAAMVVAAFGFLPPVQGALLQEAIDVAVILNALRALR